MAVFIIKLIFFAITGLSNLLSRLIFSVTAYLLVLIIQAFRLPGEAIQSALENIGEIIRGCFEYILGLVIELIGSLLSTAFDIIIEAVTGSVSVTGSALGGLAVKTRASLETLFTDLPDLVEWFAEMITTLVSDLWNNYMEAVGYVTESA